MDCKFCGQDMELYDVDFNFKGNQDNYYHCHFCKSGMIEKIRYGKSIKQIYFDEDGNEKLF